MRLPKLTRLELRVMETLWSKGPSSIRDLVEAFPENERLAYTTIQTVVYRLEAKKAIRRTTKVSNAHIFEAVISRETAQRKFVDDLLNVFGGDTQSVMARLVESGKLTLEDVEEARKTLRKLDRETGRDKP